MTAEEGETLFVGTGVFTLPKSGRLSHVRVVSATPNPDNAPNPAEQPAPEPPTFDYAGYLARQRARDKKLRKHDRTIDRLRAEYKTLKEEAEYEKRKLAEARGYRQRLRGETSGVQKEPSNVPLKEVKKEEPS